MADFEQDVLINDGLRPASLYVSARVPSTKVANMPARIHTEDGAELTVTGEVATPTEKPAKTRTYTAVLSVPRGRLVRFPTRVPVEVEVYPASATSVEVGMRPLEAIGNTDRYGEAAISVIDELAEYVAGEYAAA